MKRKIFLAILIVGSFLLVFSLVLPVMMLLFTPQSGSTGIIGGAGLPTAEFLYREMCWPLTWIGILAAIVGVAGMVFSKK